MAPRAVRRGLKSRKHPKVAPVGGCESRNPRNVAGMDDVFQTYQI